MSEMPCLGGYSEALQWATEGTEEFLSQVPLKKLRSMEVPEFIIDFHPEIQARGTSPAKQTYLVSNRMALSIAVNAERNPDFFRVASLICAANVFNGEQVPKSLRPFAFKALQENRKPPSRRGPKAGKDFIIKMLLRKLSLDIELLFDIDLARNDGKDGGSACDIVIEVAKKNGYFVEYNTVRDWCQNPNAEGFRRKADSLLGILLDTYLISLGALKPRV